MSLAADFTTVNFEERRQEESCTVIGASAGAIDIDVRRRAGRCAELSDQSDPCGAVETVRS